GTEGGGYVVPAGAFIFLCAGRRIQHIYSTGSQPADLLSLRRPAWSRLGRPLRNDIGPEKDAVSRCAALGHFFPIQSKPGDPIPRAMRSRWAGRSRIPASGVNAGLFSKVFHQPF
ncbi:MAG: hypothetical protein CW346_16145, partial [Bacillaceae bacterium]|nr:hypothetical protein [Bacillaceae bacterium]